MQTKIISYGAGTNSTAMCVEIPDFIKNNSHEDEGIDRSPFSHICHALVVTPTRDAAADCVRPDSCLAPFTSSAVGILELGEDAVFDEQADDLCFGVNDLALVFISTVGKFHRIQHRDSPITHFGEHSSRTKLTAKLFCGCHFKLSCWLGQFKYTNTVRNVKGVA